MPKVGMEPIRRVQIIQAVIETVAEQGLESLTLDAVALKAGVSKGVVNYYFKGKRELLLQSFQAFLESYNQQISDLIQPGMKAFQMMDVVIEVCFPDADIPLPIWKHDPKIDENMKPEAVADPAYSVNSLGRVFIHFLAKTVLDGDFDEIYQNVYNTYFEGIKSIIEQGMADGEMRCVDTDEAAYSIMALIEGMVMYRNTGFYPMPPEKNRMICKHFVRQYLTADKCG